MENQLNSHNQLHFEDQLPLMADKLGGQGLMRELCNGFDLLKDRQRGVITFESLKRNAPLLGLHGMSDDEVRSMMREGDLDCDGVLSQMEFCVLMFRLSPGLMADSGFWLEQALMEEQQEYEHEQEQEQGIHFGRH